MLTVVPTSFDLIQSTFKGCLSVVFPKGRSGGYAAAVNFAQQAQHYETVTVGATLYHTAAFDRTREQAALALALVGNLQGVMGVQLIGGGRIMQDRMNVLRVLECYLNASALNDPRAHCVQMLPARSICMRTTAPEEEVISFNIEDILAPPEPKEYLAFPCRYLHHRQFKYQLGHPSTLKDQLHAGAVREGCDWCPNFNLDFDPEKQK